jgi:hypothetical protein
MNVKIGTEAAQFLFWEHINRIFFAMSAHYCKILVQLIAYRKAPDLYENRQGGFTKTQWARTIADIRN